jgi:hypothetical protein
MRTSCLDCTRKHLSRAILLHRRGDRKWETLAELSQAEEESVFSYPGLARHIRSTLRLPLQDNKDIPVAQLQNTLDNCDKPEIYADTPAVPVRRDVSNLCVNLAAASILLTEAELGYPAHLSLAIAYLERAISWLDGSIEMSPDTKKKGLALVLRQRLTDTVERLRLGQRLEQPLSPLLAVAETI